MKKPKEPGMYWFKGRKRWCEGAPWNEYDGPLIFNDGGGPLPIEFFPGSTGWALASFDGKFLPIDHEIAKRGQPVVGGGKNWTVTVAGSAVHCECPTPDDWYPTVDGKVQVSIYELMNGLTRILVRGGDDFGLEKDRKISFANAWKEAQNIPTPITRDWLEDNGYVPM